MPRPKTMILIPAYNAGAELGSLLETLGGLHPRDQILVVDDGSTETEYAELCRAGWRVERFPHGGKGSALRHGFEIALREGYDWVITMDADGQHSPDDLPAFFAAIESDNADLVIGNRMRDTRTMPWLRRMTNRVTSWWLRRLTGTRVHDVQSGYRAINRVVLERVPLTTSHFDTEIEQIIRAARLGLRIGEVPIATIYGQGRSFISKSRDTYRFLRICLKLALEPRKGRGRGDAATPPERAEP